MIKSQSNIRPEKIQSHNRGYLINFNIEEKQVEGLPGQAPTIQYEYEQVFVKVSATRNEIIAAIIHNAYPIDNEIAVINNYLVDPDDVNNEQEYQTYQERRGFAKALANEVIDV